MKIRNSLIWVLGVLVATSLAFTAVAEAHLLSKRRAAEITGQLAQSVGEEAVRDPETPFVNFSYDVLRCSRRTAHRVDCPMRHDFVERGEDGQLSHSATCRALVVVKLRPRGNGVRVRVPESQIRCTSDAPEDR